MIDDEEMSDNDNNVDNDEEITSNEIEYDANTNFSMDIVIRILRFLQLLVENHNIELQDKLRTQNIGKRYDFVLLSAQYFSK